MDIHFPESTDIDNDELINISDDFSQPGDNYNDDLDWIRRDLVYSAASFFSDFKAHGPVEIKPVMIKHLPQVAVDILTNIYKACMRPSYIPSCGGRAVPSSSRSRGRTTTPNPNSTDHFP